MWQDTQKRLQQSSSNWAAQDTQLGNKDQEVSRHQSGMRASSEQKHQCRPCAGSWASVRVINIDQKMDFTCTESGKFALVFLPPSHLEPYCPSSMWMPWLALVQISTAIKQWFLYFLATKPLHTLKTELRTLKKFCLCESYLVIFCVLENKTEKLKNFLNFKIAINPLLVLMKNNCFSK